MVVDAVDADVDVRQVQVVVVQPFYARLVVLVVAHGAVRPAYVGHGVGLCVQIYQCLAGCQVAEVHGDAHAVAGHVQRDVGAHDVGLVDVYLPMVLALCGVFRHGVVQGHVHHGILYPCTVHLHGLAVQVDALAGHRQAAEAPLYAGGIDESVGVQRRVAHHQFLDDDTLLQQRHQLYVDHQPLHVGNGVPAVARFPWCNHLEVVNGQVERERQVDMADADVHAGLLGSDVGHLVYCPVLDGRQIEQHGQDDEQKDGAEQQSQYPPQGFLHRLVSRLLSFSTGCRQGWGPPRRRVAWIRDAGIPRAVPAVICCRRGWSVAPRISGRP